MAPTGVNVLKQTLVLTVGSACFTISSKTICPIAYWPFFQIIPYKPCFLFCQWQPYVFTSLFFINKYILFWHILSIIMFPNPHVMFVKAQWVDHSSPRSMFRIPPGAEYCLRNSFNQTSLMGICTPLKMYNTGKESTSPYMDPIFAVETRVNYKTTKCGQNFWNIVLKQQSRAQPAGQKLHSPTRYLLLSNGPPLAAVSLNTRDMVGLS